MNGSPGGVHVPQQKSPHGLFLFLVTGQVGQSPEALGKTAAGESVVLQFEVPAEFAPFIVPKGSIALNGVSLTVNEVNNSTFTVTIIPHTQTQTTFATLNLGDTANFEVDLIARYIHRRSS